MKIKTQKIAFSSSIILISCAFLVCTSMYFSYLQNTIIPNQIEFKINDSELQTKIEPEVNKIVKNAQKNHLKRFELMNGLSSILSKYDSIDSYNLRLGFDKKLIIGANVQKPIYAFHTKNNEIFVVGSAMKIIAKNPNKILLQNLPQIFFNDIEIKDKQTINLDFNWFFDQITLINTNYNWNNITPNKITWLNTIGFILNFQKNENDATMSNDTSFLVYLGKKNLDNKIEKFKSVAQIIRQKNLNPTEIDLNLIDRAFIK